MAEEVLASLARTLVAEFKEDQTDREPLERRWLEDYQLYMGILDQDTHDRIRKGKSKVFLRKVKTKCDTIGARIMDILFPRAGDRNWDIELTPEPTFEPSVMSMADYMRRTYGDAKADAWLAEIGQRRLANMVKTMSDQLAESPDHVGYRATMREVVRSAVHYGMGIHKGPLVDERVQKRWVPKRIDAIEGGRAVVRETWVLEETRTERQPYFRHVPVWNFFWDMTAKKLKDCRRVWEEYLMVYGDVLELAGRSSFKGDVIRDYLRQNLDGDAQERPYEAELRRLGDKNTAKQLKNRFRVVERHGWLRGDELAREGVDLQGQPEEADYFCNIWLLGGRIIKAVLAPIHGVEYPYQIFSTEKDESGLCGQGVPRIMRDPQLAYNAVVRAMLDNAYIALGPIVGVNKEALDQTDDPEDLHAFKLLKFDNAEDMAKALMFWQAQSHTSEYLALAKFFEDVSDDLTTPRWVHGNGNVADAAKTLGGLSMLMSAMEGNLAELVKTFDDDVTSQFITSLYHWNMNFNERQDIKGDFSIVAKGATALMQKEMQSQRLMQFLSLAGQPQLAGMINFAELLRAIAVAMQVPASLVYDEATIQQNQQQQMIMQVQAEQQSRLETLLNEMHSRGIAPDAALQQLLAQVLQGAAGGAPQGEAMPPQQETAAPTAAMGAAA